MIMDGRPIGPCLPECEKKDLMHAIGSTFGGILRPKIKNEACRLKVQLDAQKPLQRGIFIAIGDQIRVWLPFKYESLPNFFFGCGSMGHVAKECTEISKLGKEIREDDIPYSLALKAGSNLVGKESLQLGVSGRKFMDQCLYTGEKEEWDTSKINLDKLQNVITPTDLGHVRISSKSENSEANNQRSLELIESGSTTLRTLFVEIEQPRETAKARKNTIATDMNGDNNHKKARLEINVVNSHVIEKLDHLNVSSQLGSAAANRQADRSQ
ncbi:hypothetical protein Goklo_015972 [Gossypium klotzschianum]|uniref:Zinc knuckle CX2CX4HX4C domain-containing protein n=1 Tax=Gossypium klotzschianum TaxID=34286 RepID=A0A7J8UCP3_9ROSI|nr:hypothetical protein [Gossypium klotzschianum]